MAEAAAARSPVKRGSGMIRLATQPGVNAGPINESGHVYLTPARPQADLIWSERPGFVYALPRQPVHDDFERPERTCEERQDVTQHRPTPVAAAAADHDTCGDGSGQRRAGLPGAGSQISTGTRGDAGRGSRWGR